MHNAYINENRQRRYQIKVIKLCFLLILYDNIHDFAYDSMVPELPNNVLTLRFYMNLKEGLYT